jgi:hypothetical protein
MGKYKISLNQLAEFSGASDASKRRIIKQQINPDTFRVPRYQLTKARIKKSIELKGDLSPIHEAIKILESKHATTSWQINDKNVSLEALKRFIEIKMPSVLKKLDFQVIRPENKLIELRDVDVIVAPEIVIKGKFNGRTVIGGVKLHISKRNPFDLKKSQYVASVVYKYLKEKVAGKDDLVLPELCISLDVFNARLVAAPDNVDENLKQLRSLCDEIKLLWDQANK